MFQFYQAALILTLVILLCYVCLAVFNLYWILGGNKGALSMVMASYYQLKKSRGDVKLDDRDLMGNLWDIYYTNRDLRMLLNLLTESSGIAPSLR